MAPRWWWYRQVPCGKKNIYIFFFTIEIGHETAAEASSDFAKNENLVWRRRQGAGISSAEATGQILVMGESVQGNGAEGEEKGTKDREAQDLTQFCGGRGRALE